MYSYERTTNTHKAVHTDRSRKRHVETPTGRWENHTTHTTKFEQHCNQTNRITINTDKQTQTKPKTANKNPWTGSPLDKDRKEPKHCVKDTSLIFGAPDSIWTSDMDSSIWGNPFSTTKRQDDKETSRATNTQWVMVQDRIHPDMNYNYEEVEVIETKMTTRKYRTISPYKKAEQRRSQTPTLNAPTMTEELPQLRLNELQMRYDAKPFVPQGFHVFGALPPQMRLETYPIANPQPTSAQMHLSPHPAEVAPAKKKKKKKKLTLQEKEAKKIRHAHSEKVRMGRKRLEVLQKCNLLKKKVNGLKKKIKHVKKSWRRAVKLFPDPPPKGHESKIPALLKRCQLARKKYRKVVFQQQ